MVTSRRNFLRGSAAVAVGATAASRFGMAGATSPLPDPSTCPIEHVIVLCMENRSFDHMLGRLPGATGLDRDLYNEREDGSRVYVHRNRDFQCTLGDLGHSHGDSLQQFAGGENTGFVLNSGSQSMGYFAEADLPYLYHLAREFTTFDHWYCGLLGPTWPNREYLLAGTSAGRTSNEFSKGSLGLREKTIFHQMIEAGGDFGIYFTDLPFSALYLDLVFRYGNRFRPMYRFYEDALTGTLPPLTFLEPGYFVGTDDHPPVSVQPGQRFIADVVSAVMNSPLWPKTALLITYDEHGGFYDHVAPPTVTDDYITQAGFRVPAILVSPWARRNFVAHGQHTHASLPAFLAWRFGFQPLSARAATENDILYAFDFDNPRTDLPPFATPPFDQSMVSLCWVGRLAVADSSEVDMPGGEGPEGDVVWNEGDLSEAGRAAHELRRTGPAETPAQMAAQSGTPVAQSPDIPFHPLAKAVDAGAIPRELDQRPQPDRPTPNPFLDRTILPSRPAWDSKVVTATKLPEPKSVSAPDRKGAGFFR